MTLFAWISEEALLSSGALTVRAQARNPNDLGRVFYPALFPRADVGSTKVSDITTLDERPVADRREWNQRGRFVPLKAPSVRDIEMLPVESYFKIEEQEIQRLVERSLGNQEVFRQIVGPSIPDRTLKLVDANIRRLELDAMAAWALGAVTARNPQGTTPDVVVSLGFDAARYPTASPAWTGGASGTAWAKFIAAIEAAHDKIGLPAGCVLRLATLNAIRESAPRSVLVPDARPTLATLQQMVQDEIGGPFQFVTVEESHDVFTDGGQTVSRTKVWPANRVGFLPASKVIGSMYHAPVARAYEIAKLEPAARIDVRGMTVYREAANGGRELSVECQVNALAIPNEQAVYVVNAGI